MRTATPNDVYTQQGAKPACQEDTNAKFSHLLLAQLPRTQFTHSKLPNPHARKTPTQNFRTCYWHSYPEHSLHTASCQTRMPGRHQRKNFAPAIGTATPNTVYTQQGAKPACQEDITAICSHLLLAGLPPTTFTHSKFIYTQQAAKPFLEAPSIAPVVQTAAAAQRRPGAPQPFLEARSTAPASSRGPAATRRAATLSGGSKYCACRTDSSRGPRRRNPFWRLQVLRLHTDRSRGPRRPGAPQPFLEAPSIAPATQTGAAAHGDQARLEAPNTAPATQTEAAAHGEQARRNPFCKLQVLRLPHRQQPRPTATRLQVLLPTDRSGDQARRNPFWRLQVLRLPHRQSRGPPRPRAPQPFLEAPSTAPATQTGAAAHGDQARRNPFWRLQVLRLPRRQEPRPTATRRTLSAGSKYCACRTDSSRGPRRPGAPQPFLEAPISAPATQTEAAAHGDQARRNRFCRLQVLRLPHRQEPRPTATRRAATLSAGSKYCACHRNRRWNKDGTEDGR